MLCAMEKHEVKTHTLRVEFHLFRSSTTLTCRHSPGAAVDVQQHLRPIFVVNERGSLVGSNTVHVCSDKLWPDSLPQV